MIRKCSLAALPVLRWSILVSLAIYLSLLFVRFNNNVPLKNLSTNGEGDDESSAIDSLFAELEAVTAELRLADDPTRFAAGDPNPRDEPNVKRLEDAENQENPRGLLEGIFRKADTNRDATLDIKELARCIHAKIIEHIHRATRENVGLFTAIDNNPRNGEVSWDEYHAYFLRSRGFPESYVNYHDKKHSAMSRSLKESIMRDRARWTEAARNDPEKLALDEFLAFTHPESSQRALLQKVEELFERFDRDGDERLTEDEFSDLPSEGVALDLREDRRSDPVAGSEERRKEFRRLIDKDKNGKADRAELLVYINPWNPRHAIQEARHLIGLSDANVDGKLSLSEIFSKIDLFLGSKMVDTERSFHDEF